MCRGGVSGVCVEGGAVAGARGTSIPETGDAVVAMRIIDCERAIE